jgi:hypothetical protein
MVLRVLSTRAPDTCNTPRPDSLGSHAACGLLAALVHDW